MHDFFDKYITKYPRKTHRLLEIIPPFTSIVLISLPFWGAFAIPNQLAYFIIFFDVYFVYKSLNLAYSSYISSRKIKQTEIIDWKSRAKKLDGFEKVKHIVIIPSYKEPLSKIQDTIESIKYQTIGTKSIVVVLALEAREEGAEEKGIIFQKKYHNVFSDFLVTYHPDVADEVKGKSSNEAYAGRVVNKALVESKKYDIEYLTISSCDADTVFDKQFFALLTYKFLTVPNKYLTFFQSATVYHSNFWDIPAFSRVMAFFGTLWRAGLLVQHSRLIPHSTYSLSFKLLKQIDYWDTDVIPEDYRIFFKAFFRTKGQVHVEPMFLKTTMDSPQSHTYTSSLMSKYHQERRWSWGVADDAIYVKWWLTVKDVPFVKKTHFVGTVLLDHILWPVNWFVITISANLVVILNPEFSRTNLGYMLPRLSGFILTFSLIALIVMIYVDYTMRPKDHVKNPSKLRQFLFPVEFIFMPIAGFFLSALPALVSHVQLLLGKRLEYRVTEKV